ncbi:hypothetical protein [Adonisia turfae]|uniref:Uncharacterized protein n=1 Tax=Adonisia turfae CCMR0081 TaxID=2292702 RepID=A0A6M0REX6_9CYAN|nr:hypothetical protein [Adonisia turfae]NEZ54784.1 hypothetical protein [Adonisia turfae CCMR0081]
MSTTFEVYPRHTQIPTFNELLTAANRTLSSRLANIGARAQLSVEMRKSNGGDLIPLDLDSPMSWDIDESYAWFVIPTVAGGTDSYFDQIDDLTREVWSDYLKMKRLSPMSETVSQCLATGHYWTFRRSAGQPGIINLSYGLLAGCLATLTDGFVFSDDSAWFFDLLPMSGGEFLKRYFVPGGTENSETEDWASRCLGWIPEELSG